MAIIAQLSLFKWQDELNNLGDLERLELVLENTPDETLMRKLEDRRGHGRNDYPVRAMWNMQLAKIIFGHTTQESLIRELKRNVQLRHICGFVGTKIPSADNVTRFMDSLAGYQEEVDALFEQQSEIIGQTLADYGRDVAIDSK